MDPWKYFDITHKRHQLCNPLNTEKFERLCQLLRLKRGERVLDIACGKGEFLIRLAELYDVAGVGIDISPYCIRDSEEKRRRRVPNSDIEFVKMDGADYKPKVPSPFDLALCIGASWVYGGHRGGDSSFERNGEEGRANCSRRTFLVDGTESRVLGGRRDQKR